MGNDPVRKFNLKQFKSISHAISTYEDLELLMNHLSEGTAKTFEARGCTVMLFDEHEKQLFPVSSYGISDEYLKKGPIFENEKHTSFARGEPVFIEDIQNDKRVQYPKAAEKEGIVSMLSIPIQFHNEALGVIRIYHGGEKDFHEEDIESLCIMAEHLGLVLENNGLKNFLDHVKAAVESLPPRMLKGLSIMN